MDAATCARVERKPIENLVAYECVLAGKLLHHRANRDDNAKALELLDRAIALDPNYAHAHAWRGCLLGQQWIRGWCGDTDATRSQIVASVQTALQLDDNDSDTHRILAALGVTVDDFEKAAYHQKRALDLNPNDDLIVVQQGDLLTWTGKAEEGIDWIKRAMRLNPYHPERFWNHLGRAYFVARRYTEAADAFKHITAPDASQHAFLAAIRARLGGIELADRHAAEVLKGNPNFSCATYLGTQRYTVAVDREHHAESLAMVGLPA